MQNIHHQNIFDSTGLLPGKSWKAALVHILLLTLVVFVTEISPARADGLFDFQMKLAEKGNAEAQFKVGQMYETGRGVGKDMTKAMEWVTKAADQGHKTAGFKLLYFDIEKNGINAANKDKYAALKTKAAAGNGQAQFYVGKMYGRGVGVKKNHATALDWLNKATLLGVIEAEQETIAIQDDQAASAVSNKKRAEAARKAKAEAGRKKQLEAKRKAAEAKKLEVAKGASAKQAAAERKKQADKAARIKAQKTAEAREKERKRQALLRQRAEKQETKKKEFESDPCSGKSAKFLSTCR